MVRTIRIPSVDELSNGLAGWLVVVDLLATVPTALTIATFFGGSLKKKPCILTGKWFLLRVLQDSSPPKETFKAHADGVEAMTLAAGPNGAV